MTKRLGFLLISCVGLLGVACDGDGGDTDAGDCPPGMICLDGGMGTDGGPMDEDAGMPPPTGCGLPQPTGLEGGRCRGGTECLTGLQCVEELASVMGTPITLGFPFEINSGVEDPPGSGEASTVGGPSDVPVPFFLNGGVCSQACDPSTNGTCGECATCSTSFGAGGAFDAVGFSFGSFTNVVTEARPGLCLQNCVFTGTDNGGCPAGFACDPGSNVCEQACTTDSQCQLQWLVNRTEGLVAGTGGTGTCNTTTGLCDFGSDPEAVSGSDCSENGSADCPADVGACLLGGVCTTFQCNQPDPDDPTVALYPCPADQICVGIGGNDAAFCLGLCDTPDDCGPNLACSPSDGLPGGRAGLCFGVCENNGQCKATERCEFGRLSNPDSGLCSNHCVPEGGAADPMATPCEEGEFCNPVEDEAYGFCRPLDQICFSNASCVGGQACEVLGLDLYGRCVDGCETDEDCTGESEECVIFDDEDPATPPLTRGVCRAPGGECSASPLRDSAPIQPLRGDAQCISSQECSQRAPTDVPSTGTCQDRS